MRKKLRTDSVLPIPEVVLERLPEGGFVRAVQPARLIDLVRKPVELSRRGWRLADRTTPVVWALGTRTAGQRIALLSRQQQVVLETQGGSYVHRVCLCLKNAEILESGFTMQSFFSGSP